MTEAPELLSLPGRFQKKILLDSESGCWIWTAARTGSGYGKVYLDGKICQAHRAVYQLLVAPVDSSLDLDHYRCERRLCVNPDHVRPATRRENLLRGDTIVAWCLAKTHCPKGHPYDLTNTVLGTRGRSCRQCRVDRRALDNARARERYHARKVLTGRDAT